MRHGVAAAVDEPRDLAPFDLGFNGTRCTTNPLGVKGCDEAVAVAAFPVVANAIADALAPLGVADFAGPATPGADLARDQ
jgi:carbon-monoxide dehydrogenase large subunit